MQRSRTVRTLYMALFVSMFSITGVLETPGQLQNSKIANIFDDYKLELGRYRYLESVSVFGIFVGIFFMSVRYSVFGIGISEILVENRKFLV